jgi:hypothetical protein
MPYPATTQADQLFHIDRLELEAADRRLKTQEKALQKRERDLDTQWSKINANKQYLHSLENSLK